MLTFLAPPAFKIKIRKLQNGEHPPWDILMQGNASKDHVAQALTMGHCYVAIKLDAIVGAFLLITLPDSICELACFGLDEKYSASNVSHSLLMSAIEKAKKLGTKSLQIGIGNSNIAMLGFFQKHGFRITSLDRDYFLKGQYSKIVENGIIRRDRLVLSTELFHY